jgi:hypothetical protein
MVRFSSRNKQVLCVTSFRPMRTLNSSKGSTSQKGCGRRGEGGAARAREAGHRHWLCGYWGREALVAGGLRTGSGAEPLRLLLAPAVVDEAAGAGPRELCPSPPNLVHLVLDDDGHCGCLQARHAIRVRAVRRIACPQALMATQSIYLESSLGPFVSISLTRPAHSALTASAHHGLTEPDAPAHAHGSDAVAAALHVALRVVCRRKGWGGG